MNLCWLSGWGLGFNIDFRHVLVSVKVATAMVTTWEKKVTPCGLQFN